MQLNACYLFQLIERLSLMIEKSSQDCLLKQNVSLGKIIVFLFLTHWYLGDIK